MTNGNQSSDYFASEAEAIVVRQQLLWPCVIPIWVSAGKSKLQLNVEIKIVALLSLYSCVHNTQDTLIDMELAIIEGSKIEARK